MLGNGQAIAARIHDAQIEHKVDDFLRSNPGKVTGFMGEHNLPRADPVFEQVATMARDCAKATGDRLRRAVDEGALPCEADVAGMTRFYMRTVRSVSLQAHDDAPQSEVDTMIDVAMTAWPD